jgi:hypothetical protein
MVVPDLSFFLFFSATDSGVAVLTVKRSGTYGNIILDWMSGQLTAGLPGGVINGQISPSAGTVSIVHGVEAVNFTVQVGSSVLKKKNSVNKSTRILVINVSNPLVVKYGYLYTYPSRIMCLLVHTYELVYLKHNNGISKFIQKLYPKPSKLTLSLSFTWNLRQNSMQTQKMGTKEETLNLFTTFSMLVLQATASVGQAELFMVRLPRAPATAVRGGARLAGQNLVATLDGAGVLRFMPTSLTPRVSEVDGKVRITLLSIFLLKLSYSYDSLEVVFEKNKYPC